MSIISDLKAQLNLLLSPRSMNSDIISKLADIEKAIDARFSQIENQLKYQEHFHRGAEATFVGNNRVLTKIVVSGNRMAILVEADDKLLSPWLIVSGGYETALTDFFVKHVRDDSHCLDIGANFGYFTCLMARFCPFGKIIGIEPDQHVFDLAKDNVFINGFQGRATVLHAAAADKDATLTLYRRGTRSANTSITKMPADFVREMAEPPSQPFEINSVRVDTVLSRLNGRLDFMKVDVEGAEPLVFEGARGTIAANPQLRIVIEWSPGQIVGAGFEIDAFLSMIEKTGLKPFDITADGGMLSLEFADLPNIDYRAGIVLARP